MEIVSICVVGILIIVLIILISGIMHHALTKEWELAKAELEHKIKFHEELVNHRFNSYWADVADLKSKVGILEDIDRERYYKETGKGVRAVIEESKRAREENLERQKNKCSETKNERQP